MKIETQLSPIDLLDKTQEIEKRLGRQRIIRWGPRTIDIDILLLDNSSYSDERLTIPHIDMTNRSFVLIPLKDVYSQETLFMESIDHLIMKTGNKEEVWKSQEDWEMYYG
ncbi:2-amino-4-hydroxy-6-hydroxymethyldihydropteridine diphosphokinase [Enterococcus faecium]|uniref:2-amino-4-hydroxy-6- hydroxymethyldihydropteridine diphosphokinase n=1 Tax=Enterococcus faecium TaxID=1352 RepID=UPI000CF1C7E6|nr:2-amino-4-hydroxy-6-hydroxymethyldihydropteridine diphosphokinase [Enterococcus faecium]EGP4917793.1 2-amino-4-hydroxy-6-hydroxymethyldihydropteridine diphosphokinase [Enterococcus faecium]EGP5747237.1 2-amino-4-hydroxy-6-hydroxymethyldihydropteridine diphosphokinase [Enterococcus faecium]EMF0334098.1 2-amino-4-hydroxy-6-hydroxymethyldihydropteridine diphosphokinase [Enterococcus faecium]EMF0453232.1 2-amino-4-hydroxy-6-hydroxymethyldihydropteridine diphosphokinase [Enterococcus faecium]MCC